MNAKTFFLSALAAGFVSAVLAEPIPEANKQNGFAIGCQAYSFRYSVFEAIEKTAQCGGKVIEFFPGQKVSKDDSTSWSHSASDETIAKVQAKLKEHGVKAVNYGVVGANPKASAEEAAAEWRKIFEFAKKLGLYGVTTEDTGKLDIIEPLVKEFDIRVGIHDHPRQPKNANYRVWDPFYILEITKNRDPRIGACADLGHWQSSGLDPVFCLRVLKGRVISSHLKDKTDFGDEHVDGTKTHDVPAGTGVGEIGRCLDELKKQGFEGNISIEYEYNWTTSVPEITKCVEFVREHKGAAK